MDLKKLILSSYGQEEKSLTEIASILKYDKDNLRKIISPRKSHGTISKVFLNKILVKKFYEDIDIENISVDLYDPAEILTSNSLKYIYGDIPKSVWRNKIVTALKDGKYKNILIYQIDENHLTISKFQLELFKQLRIHEIIIFSTRHSIPEIFIIKDLLEKNIEDDELTLNLARDSIRFILEDDDEETDKKIKIIAKTLNNSKIDQAENPLTLNEAKSKDQDFLINEVEKMRNQIDQVLEILKKKS